MCKLMEDKRKIKEVYDCKQIVSDEELYPLEKWYNQLIDKSIDEITVTDVLRMMRQKVFLSLAMLKAIEFLKDNSFVGEAYDGQMLEKISEMDRSFLVSYADDLKLILEDSLEKSEVHEWSYYGEKEEFKEIAELLLNKILTIR